MTQVTMTKAKPTKEEIRQSVLADQAAALKEAAKPEPKKAEAKKPEKKAKAKKERKEDGRKITLLTKDNPHEKGSRRHGWFKSLKNGMTVSEAVAAGVRSVYLTRMAARKIVRLT